uniref:Uncharacterized protein n=1 Tax=Glossina palpalis gambiensis TaxID=67801 RepID=A0A1B0AKT4_9MUSC
MTKANTLKWREALNGHHLQASYSVISSIHHQHQQPEQKQQRIDTVVCNARGPEANLRLIIQYVLHVCEFNPFSE